MTNPPLSRRALAGFATTGLLAAVSPLAGQVLSPPPPQQEVSARITGHVFRPHRLPAPQLSELKVPAGFRIERFSENLGNVRMLAAGPGGRIYATRREQGDVIMLRIGTDGLAEGPPVRVAARPGLHGIAFHAGKVYLATDKEVFRADMQAEGTFGPLQMLIHDLPDAGQHPTRTLAVGPDEKLYIGVASATNDAEEPNPESATLLCTTLDGGDRAIFAAGLRDLVGWGWHPATGELWGMDHGIDWLGDDAPQEELNLIERGKRYGWPFFHADNKENPAREPRGGLTKDELKRVSTPMVLGYTAHASPMQLSFYDAGQFPAEYRGDAFVSMRGSWNRSQPSGYEVVRIRFRDGRPQGFEPFVTGFLSRRGEAGRPTGNVIAPDGSLLFSDDRNGIIYRVSYPGSPVSDAAAPKPIPAEPMQRQNRDGVKEEVAYELPAMKSETKLEVGSPAFPHGKEMPALHSAYDQNVSPPLRWSAGPAGTRSYVLLMEDPDATVTPLPVVHWVAWNIPADTLELHEGLPPHERLRAPAGMRQGMNSAGRSGYWGPKPPPGDPAHRYLFQVFALDRELDLPPGATRREVLAACTGHVLAAGFIYGRFERPEFPRKP